MEEAEQEGNGEGQHSDGGTAMVDDEDKAVPEVNIMAPGHQKREGGNGVQLTTDIDKECLQWRAERYVWEEWTVKDDMYGESAHPDHVRVTVRGAVRSRAGLLGPVPVHSLHLAMGSDDSVDLRFALRRTPEGPK